jgi:itaconate CoA-transferase
MRPLHGVTVVAIEQAVAAPFATRHLADLGARVIKIERPGSGDFARSYDTTVHGLSSFFVWLNRSKESLALDLKHRDAPAIVDRLLRQADVFVQNLAPGAAERLGLGNDCLRSKYSRLVVCDISGYGANGPYRDKRAYDLLIQAEAGLLSITGTEETPSKAGISIADIAAGMYAYSGILTALYQREKTKQGASVEVSMLEALGEWMGQAIYYASCSGTAPARTGPAHASIAPYGPFPTLGDEIVYLAVQNEREWERFCRIVLHLPELATDARFASNSARAANRTHLAGVIIARFKQMSVEEILTRLDEAQIATAHMNTIQDFVDHPQLQARRRWRVVESPVGPLPALIPPASLSGVEPVMGPIPHVGQHTKSILEELGFDPDTVQAWQTPDTI